jgi:hypothetical protein
MFDVGDALRDGLERASGELRAAQNDVARAGAAAAGARNADAALAKTAQAALFTEALLAAARSRLEAIKEAAR